MFTKEALSRINVWLAPDSHNMRGGYTHVADSRVIELNKDLGWLAFSSNCLTCTGMELLSVMVTQENYPQTGFEIFDKDPKKVEDMVSFVLKNTPPELFITASYDGGKSWVVIR